MRKQRTIGVLTLAALSGIAFTAPVRADDRATSANASEQHQADQGQNGRTNTADLAFPAGFKMKPDMNEAADIRSELANLTEDAAQTSHFDNFVGNFVDQDRNRIGDYKDRDTKKLDGRITQIQKAWKSKYGQEFEIKKEEKVFPESVSILQGEVANSSQAVKEFPVAPFSDSSKVVHDDQGKGDNKDVSQSNLSDGRNAALVRFPSEFGLPAMTVSLVHELPDQWRVDLPNNVTGPMLHDNLLTALTDIGEHPDQWPGDVHEGYRYYAHRVLMAAYGRPTPQSK